MMEGAVVVPSPDHDHGYTVPALSRKERGVAV
jgi:hypothetical protein